MKASFIFAVSVWAVYLGTLLYFKVAWFLESRRLNRVDFTREANELSMAAFKMGLPRGYRAYIEDGMPWDQDLSMANGRMVYILGYCHRSRKRIHLYRDSHRVLAHTSELDTMIHEIVHALDTDLKHGTMFNLAVEHGIRMVWEEARCNHSPQHKRGRLASFFTYLPLSS